MQTVSEKLRRVQARQRLRNLHESLTAARVIPSDGSRDHLIQRAVAALEQSAACINKSEAANHTYWEGQWLDLADIQVELAHYCVRVLNSASKS